MRILGVDPGSRSCGIGIIEVKGSKYTHIMHLIISPTQLLMYQKLGEIMIALNDLISQYKPSVVSLEQAFVYKNVHTALALGQVRGVIMAIAAKANLEFVEYAPRTIKKTISGDGAADKVQMQKMVQILLGLAQAPSSDAADALAIALCHANHLKQWTIAKL